MTSPAAHPAWFDLGGAVERGVTGLPEGPLVADVVVVGLGASGLAACRRLARRGADVVGLDAHGIAAGAAGANGGFLLAGLADFHHDAVARHGRDVARAAYAWTLDLLDEEFATEPTARRTGSLRLAADDAERRDIEVQVAALRADGFPVEPWDGPEGFGLLVPGDGVVHPVARCRRMAEEAVAAGARLHAPARVVAVHPGAVQLDTGPDVRVGQVIVAVDGGLELLLPALPVRTARLQMLATAPAPVTRSRPEYRRMGYDYVQQLPSGEVLLGGGRDVGGAEEWRAPAIPSAAVQAHLDRELARLDVDAPVTHRWAAHAAFTDDRLPVAVTIGATLHVVGGHSGHGNLLGPALAERAADVALDGGTLDLPFA